jgi:L-seryl-tRNA(Ser) seleniumtransferase
MTQNERFRKLPSVDKLLAEERVRALSRRYSGDTVVALVREELAAARQGVARGVPAPPIESLADAVERRVEAALSPSLRPVINATGVIIHTNLGRAPLSDEAIAAMDAVSRGYSNLEFDLAEGERGSRHGHLDEQIRRLTGAEAGFAVNNNASAVLLALSALASHREVIISRGQLVEIGGGFRVPDVMAESGAFLMEVGATNRTYLRDYASAITDDTAALMRVHASNFKVSGFTASTSIGELAQLARERGLLLIDDLGSGCLLDTIAFGLAPEPTPQESIAAGADVVLFSGDKLLGGPQAGIIAGRQEIVGRLRRHPLARAVRLDKASIAGLAATFDHYLRDEALTKVPVWRKIATPVEDIAKRARRWARAVGPDATVVDGRSMIGGGSLPEESLPTKLLAIDCSGDNAARLPRGAQGPRPSAPPAKRAGALARALRAHDPAVVARIEHETVLLDPRTVDRRDDRVVVEALRAALREPGAA